MRLIDCVVIRRSSCTESKRIEFEVNDNNIDDA